MLDETIFIIFAELARFKKSPEECTSDLDRMLYVLKNSWILKKQTGWLCGQIYKRILEACEIAKFSKEKRIQYNKDMIDERRRQGELNAAIHSGIEQGIEQGREQGREEGARQKSIQIAVKLLAKGFSIQDISEVTGLSQEDIAQL